MTVAYLTDAQSLERLREEDTFTVYSPQSLYVLIKAEVNIEDTRPIGGYCSTEDLDRQQEVVVAKGLDFSDFVKYGYFNDNHKQDTSAVLGYPRLARLEKGKWYTEGNLIKGYDPADKIWELAKSLQNSKSPRRLGFSIEGKVIQRDNKNRILKAKVRNVAITNCPVNTSCTWSILAKSFGPERDIDSINKALYATHQTPGYASGSALRKESLDSDSEIIRDTRLSFTKAVLQLQKLRPQYSESTCKKIVKYAMEHRQ